MTISISNASAKDALTPREEAPLSEIPSQPQVIVESTQTLASRLIIFTLSAAIVLSTLAFGTVHSWSLALLQAGAGLIVLCWYLDGWQSRRFRISRNLLQLPLAGLFILGLVQLLPVAGTGPAGELLSVEPVRTLSIDPYATRITLIIIAALSIYFAAALAFIDSPKRLRLIVRTIIIFGFLLAVFSMMQVFISPDKIFGLRQTKQSLGFGPFINRHHFAGYMELLLALPLGLLLSGSIPTEQRFLYGFATALMAVALIMTNSRGGMLSLTAEILFLSIIFFTGRLRKEKREEDEGGSNERRGRSVRAVALSIGLCFALILGIFAASLFFGGEDSLSRLVGTVNSEDPTTGRAHFWRTTLNIIRDNPIIGTGLGAFSVAYTRYDTRNGIYRLEQAHNDYLQVLSDGGIIGAALGLFFIVSLFRLGFSRLYSKDKYRRGVAMGALAGCFAVLVHSFFDFTLHTPSNALLFLTLAALATINGRVEQQDESHRRCRRRHRRHHESHAHPSDIQSVDAK